MGELTQGMDAILAGGDRLARGTGRLADSVIASREREKRDEQIRMKQEKDAALSERLKGLGLSADEINQRAASDPNFGVDDLAASSGDFTRASLELGDPNITRALDPAREVIKARGAEAAKTAKKTGVADKAAKEEEKARKAAAKKAEAEIKKLKREDQGIARNEAHRYRNDPTVKSTQKVSGSFNKILNLSKMEPSAARDLAYVFSFMKSLDEGSVVRESEFKTAAEARSFFSKYVTVQPDGSAVATRDGQSFSIPSALVQMMQKIDPKQKGSFLLPDQISSFTETAASTYLAQLDRQAVADRGFVSVAKDSGLDPMLVTGGFDTQAEMQKVNDFIESNKVQKEEAQQAKPMSAISQEKAQELMADPKLTQDYESKITAAEASLGRPLTPEEQQQALQRYMRGLGIRMESPEERSLRLQR